MEEDDIVVQNFKVIFLETKSAILRSKRYTAVLILLKRFIHSFLRETEGQNELMKN